MITTLEMLTAKHNKAVLTLTEVREEYFEGITTKHLLRLIRERKVTLKVSQPYPGRRAPKVVHLADLADWLDELATSNKPAADQAA